VHTVLRDAAFPAVALITLFPLDVTFGTSTSSDTGDSGDSNADAESASDDSDSYVASLVDGIVMHMNQ